MNSKLKSSKPKPEVVKAIFRVWVEDDNEGQLFCLYPERPSSPYSESDDACQVYDPDLDTL